MVGKKQGSAQLCSPADKGYSAFPLPHIPPFTLIPHHSVLEHTGSLLPVLSWYLVLPVWHAMATPTRPGSKICLVSVTTQFPSSRCLLCRAAHQKHLGTFHKLMPLLSGKGCVLPSHPPRVHGTVSHEDEEMNVPRHQGDLGLTNARCNPQK